MKAPARGGTDASLATQVYRRLRSDLLDGRLLPGSKLKVLEIAGACGVGATPVREALSSLAAEGLVDRIDQRGFRAAPVTMESFEDLLRARCWMEEIALRESITAGGPAWEDGLVLARYRLSRTRQRSDPSAWDNDAGWDEAHIAFHRALLAGCPSATMLGFCEAIRERANRYRRIANMAAYPTRDVAAEHEALAEAALARRVPEACRLLVEHYQRTAGYLRLALSGVVTGSDRAV